MFRILLLNINRVRTMKQHIIKRARGALVPGLVFIPAAVPAAQDVGSL